MSSFLDFPEARQRACRRLPRGIFEYIDRGSEAETAISYNRAQLDAVRIAPRVLQTPERVRPRTILGTDFALPLAVAPTAFAGLVRHRGDIALARAAAARGVPFTVATESLLSVEEVRAATDAALWFQLYLWDSEAHWRALLERVRATGIEVLVLTVDTRASPLRSFNIRNGFGLPLRFGARNVTDVMRHPTWAADVLGRSLISGGLPRFAHHPQAAQASITGRGLPPMRHAADLNWDHLAKIRDAWPGKLVVKGVLHPEDALRCRDLGTDGLVVSSHGMRNLDISVSPIEMPPSIRAAVGPDMPLLADSGVQRGSDVLKLLMAGADAVLLGRAMLYALASGGEAGAVRMIDILRTELETTMSLAGVPDPRPSSGISATSVAQPAFASCESCKRAN